MKTIHRTALLAAILILTTEGDATADPGARRAPAPGSTGEAGDFGSIVHDEVRMDVKGATAVWNEETRQLTIHLLPFEPSDDEVALLRRGREGEIQRELIDRQTWPHSNPRASYSISWYEPETVGDYQESTVFLYAYGVAGSNSNINLTYLMSFDEGIVSGSLTGTMEPGEDIHLVSSGEDSLSGSTVSWNLDIRATILGALPDA